jgi:hypothetical protein
VGTTLTLTVTNTGSDFTINELYRIAMARPQAVAISASAMPPLTLVGAS